MVKQTLLFLVKREREKGGERDTERERDGIYIFFP